MRERILHLTAKDFEFQTFRAGGKGGQHQNKTDSGARCIHQPSGARGEARDGRSQHQNRRKAFSRMAHSPEFQRWVRLEHARRVGEIDAWVDEQMRPENLVIEVLPGQQP